MTDVRHIIENPDLAAADAEFIKAMSHLEAGREFLRRAFCQAPRLTRSANPEDAWQSVGDVASRVVDQIVKREAAE